MNNRDRCDHCKKWVKLYGTLITLATENLIEHLQAENEFSVCEKCFNSHTEKYWVKWIPIAREKGLSFKTWLA